VPVAEYEQVDKRPYETGGEDEGNHNHPAGYELADDLTPAAKAARAEAELDELALRASRGDQAALGELLDRIRGPVLWQCRSRMSGRTVGQQTPEDVAQEVLIAVCGALSRFRPTETRWMAFVYGIVRNKVIDAYRAASRDRSDPMEELPDHVDDDDRAGPEAAVLRSADLVLLQELLDELPETQREVLVLRVAMGYSAEETARTVGSTPGAVRVTQHRAMLRLRALLLAKQRAAELD
jgi:RNA polymerase sigma-70 factor, ECF subfamily